MVVSIAEYSEDEEEEMLCDDMFELCKRYVKVER